eukprot:SAG11_NODE_675_length_7800_cov_6.380730_6_plen_169_part_00
MSQPRHISQWSKPPPSPPAATVTRRPARPSYSGMIGRSRRMRGVLMAIQTSTAAVKRCACTATPADVWLTCHPSQSVSFAADATCTVHSFHSHCHPSGTSVSRDLPQTHCSANLMPPTVFTPLIPRLQGSGMQRGPAGTRLPKLICPLRTVAQRPCRVATQRIDTAVT